MHKQRQVLKDYINNYKLSKGCQLCGYDTYSCALQFHHVSNKTESINKLVKQGVNLFTIKREIEHCIVVCANCHAVIHGGGETPRG